MIDPVTFAINFAFSRFTGAVAAMLFVTFLGLSAGIYLSWSLISLPALEAMPATLQAETAAAMMRAAHDPKLLLVLSAAAPAGIAAAFWCASAARPWLLAAMAFLFATVVVTALACAPLNLVVSEWTAKTAAGGAGMADILAEWARFNDLRLGLSLLALAMALRAMQQHERRPTNR